MSYYGLTTMIRLLNCFIVGVKHYDYYDICALGGRCVAQTFGDWSVFKRGNCLIRETIFAREICGGITNGKKEDYVRLFFSFFFCDYGK